MTDQRPDDPPPETRPGCNVLLLGLLLLLVAIAIVIGWLVSDPRAPQAIPSSQPEALPAPPAGQADPAAQD